VLPAWLTPALLAVAAAVSPTTILEAQVGCLASTKPPVCGALVPGTPLPFLNSSAPSRLDLSGSNTFELVILGHSESRGYHTYLTQLLAANPIVTGKTFTVFNDFIGGTEAWRWSTPGQRGYDRITAVLKRRKNPMIVLGLFSNNVSFPIRSSRLNTNFKKFAADIEAITDRLYDGGKGAMMVYHSSHRYKPGNFLPCAYEKCSLGYAITQMATKKRVYVKAGPEQHNLHWCCHPTCYAVDNAHTNALGDQLMAQTWYNFLLREITGSVMEPYGSGSSGTAGFVPVLNPAGGAPRVGNSSFSLAVSQALGGTDVAYVFGAKRQAGPILVSLDVVVLAKTTGTGAGKGVHRLSLAIPKSASLIGLQVFAQAAVADPVGSTFGFAMTQALSLVVGS
jgi:hypothetical protein